MHIHTSHLLEILPSNTGLDKDPPKLLKFLNFYNIKQPLDVVCQQEENLISRSDKYLQLKEIRARIYKTS